VSLRRGVSVQHWRCVCTTLAACLYNIGGVSVQHWRRVCTTLAACLYNIGGVSLQRRIYDNDTSPEIGNLKKLKYFNLSGNNFSDEEKKNKKNV